MQLELNWMWIEKETRFDAKIYTKQRRSWRTCFWLHSLFTRLHVKRRTIARKVQKKQAMRTRFASIDNAIFFYRKCFSYFARNSKLRLSRSINNAKNEEKKSRENSEEIFSFYRIFISYSCAFSHVIFGHSMKFRLISVPTRRSFAPWKCILNQPKHIYMNPLCAFSTEWLLLSIGNQTQAKTRCSDEWKQAWIDR